MPRLSPVWSLSPSGWLSLSPAVLWAAQGPGSGLEPALGGGVAAGPQVLLGPLTAAERDGVANPVEERYPVREDKRERALLSLDCTVSPWTGPGAFSN